MEKIALILIMVSNKLFKKIEINSRKFSVLLFSLFLQHWEITMNEIKICAENEREYAKNSKMLRA
jgi:hypothetical protein